MRALLFCAAVAIPAFTWMQGLGNGWVIKKNVTAVESGFAILGVVVPASQTKLPPGVGETEPLSSWREWYGISIKTASPTQSSGTPFPCDRRSSCCCRRLRIRTRTSWAARPKPASSIESSWSSWGNSSSTFSAGCAGRTDSLEGKQVRIYSDQGNNCLELECSAKSPGGTSRSTGALLQ